MKLMDGSQELFDEIVQLFMADTPPHMQRIKDGLAQGNPEWVRHSAHTIKGMVSIFSAEKTTDAAALVEKAVGQEDCAEAVIELEIALNELRDVISKHCAPRK
jgi:HPt (histidine-containing phosphotransfer) domain-containing protein